MKRAFSFLFLFILVTNLTGFYIFFAVRISIHHKEIAVRIGNTKHTDFEQIRMTSEEYDLLVLDENEIRIQEKLYDVAFIERDKCDVIIYVEHDEFEERLLAILDVILLNQEDDRSSFEIDFLEFTNINNELTFKTPFTESARLNTKYFFARKESVVNHNSPPPKI